VAAELPSSLDQCYLGYVLCFWQLCQQTITAGPHPTVKRLDYYLLCAAEDVA
jgi:hypothetical protein